MIYRYFLTLLFFMGFQNHKIWAQPVINGCDVLESVFEYLESKNAAYERRLFKDSSLFTQYKYHFHYLDMVISLDEPQTKKIFEKFVGDSLFKWNLSQEIQPSTETCSSLSKFRVSTDKSGKYPKFSLEDFTDEVIGCDTVYYSPIGIFFSKMFRFNDTILLLSNTREGITINTGFVIHYFMLRREADKWKVIKHEVDVR